MAPVTLTLKRICTACGTERKPKNLLYDPQTFEPYCGNPWLCNEDHPNSPTNLIKNQKQTVLVEADVAKETYSEHLKLQYANDETLSQMHKIMKHPLTVRIQNPEHAIYLINLQHTIGAPTISEAVRYCIEFTAEQKAVNRYHEQIEVARETDTREKATARVLEEVETGESESESEELEDDLTF